MTDRDLSPTPSDRARGDATGRVREETTLAGPFGRLFESLTPGSFDSLTPDRGLANGGRRSLNPALASGELNHHMTNQAEHLTAMTDAWTRLTGSVLRSAMAANTAALSAFDPEAGRDGSVRDAGPGPSSDTRPGVDSVLYDGDDWVSRRSVEHREEITVGDSAEFAKTLSEEDVRAFADASGDTNRLHLDDEFAEGTRFGGRIAHGTLVSGLISAALARLPGVTIYLSQDLEFRAPVSIGDRVRSTVEVVEVLGNDQYRLRTTVTDDDGDRTIVDGEAVVIIDSLPE